MNGQNINALEVESLSAGYGRFDVIHDISLHVAQGEAVALLGPNGAGKTTILNAIMGMVSHQTGTVHVNGINISRLKVHERARGHIAIVPEGRRLFTAQSVEDNLRLGAMKDRKDHALVNERLSSVFELFPVVERYRARLASDLSGGEQQMVAVGRMMMSDPRVMILDEPSLGLAPLAIDDMARALINLREKGKSILLVEQRIDLALAVCDRIYVLSGGKIVDHSDSKRLSVDGRALIDAYLG